MRRLSETDRLEAFSDGVMAVIITIMAFDVKPPGGASLYGAAQGPARPCSSTFSASPSSAPTGTTITTCFARPSASAAQ